MNTTVLVTFVLIILARVTDVTLDTIRTVAVVQGRRVFAAGLGFFQAVVYVCAIAKVLLNMDHPVYALAYGIGFAAGTYLGIAIEQRLAFGHRVVTLVTSKGPEMLKFLRTAGYQFASVTGHTGVGDMNIVYVSISRKEARMLIQNVKAVDDNCVCILNDVQVRRFRSHHAGAGPAIPQIHPA